jgi:hypothetical protein
VIVRLSGFSVTYVTSSCASHGLCVGRRRDSRIIAANKFGGDIDMRLLVIAAGTICLAVSSAQAAGKESYASARAACLAQAGTTEAIFSARKATYAQGFAYKQCMTAKGHDVVVRKGDGARLY